MIYLIPYAVDVPRDRAAIANWILAASIIGAFILQMSASDEEMVMPYVLDGWNLQGMFGHMWLHGGIFHLLGNMVFLWVFGNAVCSKVNNFLYLPIYLLVGLAAASAHLIFDGDPAIGASGAINGIVGMYLILFPTNEIDCAFGFFFMFRPIFKTFSVAGFWIILLWLCFDILGVILGGGGVAYWAHLGGFAAGVLLALLLLKLKLVTMWDDEGSVLQLIDEWRQERQDNRLRKEALAAVENAQNHPDPIPQTISQPETVSFSCACGKRIKAPIHLAGKTGKCPACRTVVVVPSC